MVILDRTIENVLVLVLQGQFVHGHHNGELKERIVAHLAQSGTSRVVIDLKDVPLADSSGIGELVGARTRIMDAGGRFVLAHVPERIMHMLQTTHLDAIFERFPTAGDAVTALTHAA